MLLQTVVFPLTEEICRRQGVDVEIRDGEAGAPGREIREDTARRIDQADAVIVVATTAQKPNSWIEFGWADGFWHEPILLVRTGFDLPSDIVSTISVFFTPSQITGVNETATRRLAERLATHVVHKVRSDRKAPRFPHLQKRSTNALGSLRIYNRFSNAFTFDQWSQVIEGATSEIIIASPRMIDMVERSFSRTSASGERRPTPFAQLLLGLALEKRLRVTLVMQHPDNYSVDHMLRDTQEETGRLRAALQDSYDYWAQVVLAYRQSRQARQRDPSTVDGDGYDVSIEEGFRVVQLHRRYLPYRVTMTDRRAIVTLRFYTEAVNSGLCIECSPSEQEHIDFDRPFYEQVREELQFLIEENRQHIEPAFQDFLRRRGLA